MSTPATLDVSRLPSFAFGRRDPRWVGVMLLIAIEGSVFGLVCFTYFYTRLRLAVWPPTAPGPREMLFGGAVAAVLLASAVTMHKVDTAAIRADIVGLRRWLMITTGLSLSTLVLRGVELSGLPFRWDSNVFGSVFWAALSLHTLHLIAGNVENMLFLALFFRGPIEKKHLVDAEVNGVYWYFVVLSWLPLYAVFYLGGLLGW